MTAIALYHSVLGVRQGGVLDAAARLRQDGHDVLVVDLYDGRTFDDYPPAMAFAQEEVGHDRPAGQAFAMQPGRSSAYTQLYDAT
jgi:dienelactone hydrolase